MGPVIPPWDPNEFDDSFMDDLWVWWFLHGHLMSSVIPPWALNEFDDSFAKSSYNFCFYKLLVIKWLLSQFCCYWLAVWCCIFEQWGIQNIDRRYAVNVKGRFGFSEWNLEGCWKNPWSRRCCSLQKVWDHYMKYFWVANRSNYIQPDAKRSNICHWYLTCTRIYPPLYNACVDIITGTTSDIKRINRNSSDFYFCYHIYPTPPLG